MKIDPTKKYRYRMGDCVRILAVDAKGPMHNGKPQPVIVLDEQAGEVTFHYSDGKFSGKDDDELDLIEVREPREWTIYADKDQYSHLPFLGADAVRVREIID